MPFTVTVAVPTSTLPLYETTLKSTPSIRASPSSMTSTGGFTADPVYCKDGAVTVAPEMSAGVISKVPDAVPL